MKILIIDTNGTLVSFAMQCISAGHEVKVFLSRLKDGSKRRDGDGLVPKISDWTLWMRWADLIIAYDNAKYVHALEPYRKYGYPILGCPLAGVPLELDRAVGQKVLKDAGVRIMDYKTFTSYDDAENHVKRTMKRYVSKPTGDADKALSYVSKSPADMIFMLRKWKKLGRLKQPFILQEFCPGVEMAVGGWFGRNGWNAAISENWEHKKLFNGNLGVNTGEQGTVCRYVKNSKLAEKVLFPITEYLHSIKYTGYIDVAVIIEDTTGDPLPLELTARMGCPHMAITSALHQGDPANWMRDLLDGYDTLDVSRDISTGVVVSIPDYPYNSYPSEKMAGIPVYCDHNKNIFPFEICMGVAPTVVGSKVVDMPCWVTTGSYVLVATGIADTVSLSAKRAYETIKNIEIPNSPGYRTDIGARLEKELLFLRKHGYATGLKY